MGGQREGVNVMRKLLFIVVFTVAHAFLTLSMITWGCRHGFGGSLLQRLNSLVVAVFMSPVVLPMVYSDPDGDRIPRWFQWSSYFLNSMIWAVAILLLFTAVKSLSRKRGGKADC
jgi:hypothetical protein